jgi:hypothetical protein
MTLANLPSAVLSQPSPPIQATSTASAQATPSAVRVTVTAAKGNVFVRRGPNLAFNPISVLRQGQSATASARDVLAKWLMIDTPGNPASPGWISIASVYTFVSGDVESLPEIEPTFWPLAASLRNCTHDQMTADPGGIPIPPIDAFPENDVRINPGTYTVHDVDVDGYPEVLKVDIREGSAVDIRVDGNGEKKKCPLP